MMEYRPPVCVIPFAQLERDRVLAVPGQVLVGVGDRVESLDLIARALKPGALYALDAARDLGIGNSALPRYMSKTEGEEVKANQVLAARGGIAGLFRRRCVSPVTGTISSVVQGRILLEQEPLAVELRAYIRGQVSKVIPNYGVTIRTTGASVLGLWSSGEEAYGIVRVMVEERQQPLTPDCLDSNCHGAIVVGGSAVTEEALRAAEALKVRAVVVGGMDTALIDLARSCAFPVIVTQGMGEHPILAEMFQLFRQHQGREAAVLKTSLRGGMERPEILIPLPAEQGQMPLWEPHALEPDAYVTITRMPYQGQNGQVTSTPERLCDPNSGLQFVGVRVLLDSGQTVVVPLTNLHVIERDAL